jgi:dienelactone hydrolase
MATIGVEPRVALLDDAVRIRVGGLGSGQRVRIAARSEQLKAGAEVEFVADGSGIVDTSTCPAVTGSYEGVDAGGLFWAADIDDGVDLFTDVLRVLGDLAPIEYDLIAKVEGEVVASARLIRETLAPGIRRIKVSDGRLRGSFFSAEAAHLRPGVIIVGGSDGGTSYEFVAALLAARGFGVLSLAWFGCEDLPREARGIPLEYFEEAADWLLGRKEIVGAQIGFVGTSLGGELALLAGAKIAAIGAVVALVPSGVVWGDKWTFRGQPVPGIAPRSPADQAEQMKEWQELAAAGMPVSGTNSFLQRLDALGESVERFEIPVEETSGPILLFSGDDDTLWPSKRLAEIAERRLERHPFDHPFEHVCYEGAGHLAFLPPNIPTTRDWTVHPRVKIKAAVGGNPRGTAYASADSWTRMIAFLSEHLTGAPNGAGRR